MDESTSTVRLPGAAARRFGHVCGFFHDREEEYRVLLPLAKEGFERGERSSTSSIPSIVPSGCAAWRRSASARLALGIPVRSRSGPGSTLTSGADASTRRR